MWSGRPTSSKLYANLSIINYACMHICKYAYNKQLRHTDICGLKCAYLGSLMRGGCIWRGAVFGQIIGVKNRHFQLEPPGGSIRKSTVRSFTLRTVVARYILYRHEGAKFFRAEAEPRNASGGSKIQTRKFFFPARLEGPPSGRARA